MGLDVLARTSFLVDHGARRVSFAPAVCEPAAAPLEIVWPFVAVRLLLAGAPIQLRVDNRQQELVLFKSRLAPALMPLPWRRQGGAIRIGLRPTDAIRPP